MHPLQYILLALIVAIIAFAVWMSAHSSIEERRGRRGRLKRAGAQTEALCDPVNCDHVWTEWDSGTCMPSYSSYGGPDLQETWTVEHCPRCGSKVFSCTGSCDCHSECAAPYEG